LKISLSTWALVAIAGLSAVAQNAWHDVPLGGQSPPPALAQGDTRAGVRAQAKADTDWRDEAANRAARSIRDRNVLSATDLIPRTPQGRQSSFWPNPQQVAHARTIVRVGRELGLPPRAAVIAVATALQESHLNNYGHLGTRNDHDSLGLFQQRPSTGWGTPQQVTTPRYAASRFYRKLMRVRNWQHRPLTEVAQAVQVSAFPRAYAKWEAMAAHLVRAAHGAGPYAHIGKPRP
jgi:hypothetical protein